MTPSPLLTVTYRHEWDMGHRLPQHDGKCRRLHGHRYVAEIDVTGPVIQSGSATGMVVDFGDLKAAVRQVVDDRWDHRTMLWQGDPLATKDRGSSYLFDDRDDDRYGIVRVPFIPTAENIAYALLHEVAHHVNGVTRVRVYETPGCWAEVRA